MTNEMFIKLVLSLASVLGIIITSYIIPLLKSKIGSEELSKVTYYISVAVRCAEQIYTKEQWKEKKEYVMDYVQKIIYTKLNIKLTYDELDTMVEGVVNEIKRGKVNN